ncbi:hypothetical protein F511_13090 [Dorcoceras hygrometricum]|uniref:Uncharacterized protein n=1 Tax=Dorcoceras hygrometricum TaxID=472368 RepID=A0A2Z7C4D6_9LAMI|nr:hypothetical protein F511_13090 [Dorcoceras hygrometricum]
MSLFDLQDVCIVIGSLATLDLPMVVDLIGIYVLKGPYCTLTTTNWFLQALSVIPRGSLGDVSRRFTMIRWATPPTLLSASSLSAAPPPSRRCPVIVLVSIIVSRRFRPWQNPSALIVQTDGGLLFPVVDLIRRSTAAYLLKCQFPCETGRSQAPRHQQGSLLLPPPGLVLACFSRCFWLNVNRDLIVVRKLFEFEKLERDRSGDHDRILLVKTIGTSSITAAAGHGGGAAAHDGVGGDVR